MGKKFDYKDPDSLPVKGASIATIDITLNATNLCDCSKKGAVTIEIEVDVHGNGSPWQNFNEISKTAGEFIIDGNKVQFQGIAPGGIKSSKDKAIYKIDLNACPGGEQKSKGEIKIVDLTRKGATKANWTGVAQIYEYTYSYTCEKEEVKRRCVSCKEKKAFDFDVKLLKSDTGMPNL